jgi:hypothetical protein
MKIHNTPRCVELPGCCYCLESGASDPLYFVQVVEGDMDHVRGEVFFRPAVRYTDRYGQRPTAFVGEVSDLPDFSEKAESEVFSYVNSHGETVTEGGELYSLGDRQCFVWGYANIEDAMAVVRHLNSRLQAEE